MATDRPGAGPSAIRPSWRAPSAGGPPFGCLFVLFGLFAAGTVIVAIWAGGRDHRRGRRSADRGGGGLVALVVVILGAGASFRAFRRISQPLDDLIDAAEPGRGGRLQRARVRSPGRATCARSRGPSTRWPLAWRPATHDAARSWPTSPTSCGRRSRHRGDSWRRWRMGSTPPTASGSSRCSRSRAPWPGSSTTCARSRSRRSARSSCIRSLRTSCLCSTRSSWRTTRPPARPACACASSHRVTRPIVARIDVAGDAPHPCERRLQRDSPHPTRRQCRPRRR